MAEKKTTKKKTSKKVETNTVQLEEVAGVENVVVESVDDETPIEQQDTESEYASVLVDHAPSHYRFISTISRLNISNVVFDNIKVVIYETTANDKYEAILEFRDKIMSNFANGVRENFDKFMIAVFGEHDNVILEEISINSVTTEIISIV